MNTLSSAKETKVYPAAAAISETEMSMWQACSDHFPRREMVSHHASKGRHASSYDAHLDLDEADDQSCGLHALGDTKGKKNQLTSRDIHPIWSKSHPANESSGIGRRH